MKPLEELECHIYDIFYDIIEKVYRSDPKFIQLHEESTIECCWCPFNFTDDFHINLETLFDVKENKVTYISFSIYPYKGDNTKNIKTIVSYEDTWESPATLRFEIQTEQETVKTESVYSKGIYTIFQLFLSNVKRVCHNETNKESIPNTKIKKITNNLKCIRDKISKYKKELEYEEFYS